MSTTPEKNYSPVSLTPVKHVFAGVNDTGEAPLNSDFTLSMTEPDKESDNEPHRYF